MPGVYLDRLSKRSDDDTAPFTIQAIGSEVYHRAMFAIGLSGGAITAVLMDTMRAIGATPGSLTIDELGAMLPEIERRLRMLCPPDDAGARMARLRRLVLEWA
jgi:hypothetical protein